MSRLLVLDPVKISIPETFSNEVSCDIQMENVSEGNVAYKFLVRDPQLCHVRPPRGILPPKSQQKVIITFNPLASGGRVSRIIANALTVSSPSMPEPEFKSIWTERRNELERHGIQVVYGDREVPTHAGDSSVIQSAIQSPAPPAFHQMATEEPVIQPFESRLDESAMLKSAVEKPQPQEPVVEECHECHETEEPAVVEQHESPVIEEPQETSSKSQDCFAELQALKAEYEKLKSDYTKLQAENAVLANKADGAQKKMDADAAADRADRRSWIMLYAAILILFAVLIYSFIRPSSNPKL